MNVVAQDRTLVFCTAFVPRGGEPYYTWDARYRIWVEAVKRSGLHFDQILLVDDGSETLPNWPDLTILREDDDLRCSAPTVVYHFSKRLGRRAISDFPGWVRSFFFAARYAEANGLSKIVHLEADAFLITQRAYDYVNGLRDGWTAFWCSLHNRPESGIQIIAGAGLKTYKLWAARPIESFADTVIETTLPFSQIARDLQGDRYGEVEARVPPGADWCMQAYPPSLASYAGYFWWMPWFATIFPALGTEPVEPTPLPHPSATLAHEGIYYLRWLKEAEQILAPRMYFEIGTYAGDSLKMIGCDAVCVDPNFAITTNALMRRRNTHFFQGSSDEFFADNAAVTRLFPLGIDLAFLDGLHHYEVLLRDFINAERFANPWSMYILHDCLPLNLRMADRVFRLGDESEPEGIRDFWTGDVWKAVLILGKYRPELSISYINSGPTGLVVCTGLDRHDRTLSERYDDIVREFADLTLSAFGLDKLWDLHPTFSGGQIVAGEQIFSKALYRGKATWTPASMRHAPTPHDPTRHDPTRHGTAALSGNPAPAAELPVEAGLRPAGMAELQQRWAATDRAIAELRLRLDAERKHSC